MRWICYSAQIIGLYLSAVLLSWLHKGQSKFNVIHFIRALPCEGTSLRKRSGMAHVVEGFHSFTCTTRVYPRLPSRTKLVLIC